jgi:hypothetical protein
MFNQNIFTQTNLSMKKILFTLAAIFFTLISLTKAQTTAMNFTQTDCDGMEHQLFSELDAGNVIILEYMMLNCAPCVTGTKAMESVIKPYDLSHPGRVHLYSFAFLNSYTCEQIVQWKRDFDFSHPAFSQGEEQVAYYGGMGMPTLVVVGTNEHKVFYKSIGYTPDVDDQVREALDSALLYTASGVEDKIITGSFKVYPTLFTEHLNVETGKEFYGAELIVFDAFGRQVLNFRISENGRADIAVQWLSKGVYIARLKSSNGFSEGVKLVRQ